jgi:transposase
MSKNKFYSKDIKLKAVEMKLSGVPIREIMEQLDIKSESQIYTWYYWHRDGEFHRFEQPIGKQYTFGHGPISPEITSNEERIKQLEMQVEILKKYRDLERRWSRK